MKQGKIVNVLEIQHSMKKLWSTLVLIKVRVIISSWTCTYKLTVEF